MLSFCFKFNLYHIFKITLMSTESEAVQNSSEHDSVKRQAVAYEDADQRQRMLDDQQLRYHPSVSPQPSHPMMYRHGMEQLMMRQVVPHSISPRMPQAEDSDLTDAMIFLNRIKEEFSDNLHVYDSFLETMRDFRFEKIDAEEVCKAVRILFKDKPHLIRLFDEYLPHHLRYSDMSRSYDMQMSERHKNMPFRGSGFMPKPPAPIHMGQMPPGSALHINRMGHPMPAHPSFIGRPVRQSPPPQVNASQEAQQRFKSTTSQQLLPPQSPRHKTAHDFVQQVKKRYLNKPLIYKQFVDLLQNSKNSFEKLYTQVSALLCDSPDLIEKFEKNFKTPQSPDEMMYTVDKDPLKKIKQKLAEQGTLEQFLKIINYYNQNYLSAIDVIALVEPLIEDKENVSAFKSFIKYEETVQEGDTNRYKGLEKIGSYRILPMEIALDSSLSLSKEVLNCTCISVSTHESEDDTYVFRHKNHSEDLITRIVDERSEADLVMDRLKYLIIKLEEIYESLEDVELAPNDIHMSGSLVKETLRHVYDNKCPEILESILVNPKKAIPIVLKRLNKVFRENLERLRDFKKFWRDIIEEHYYKAYDTKGVLYRSQEKNYLSLRNVECESRSPLSFDIKDLELLENIREFFNIFAKNHASNSFRKPSVESQLQVFDSFIEELHKDSISKTTNFDTYALYYYLLILYVRLEEIKALKLGPISSNPMAVSISLQEEYHVEDRYTEILRAARDLMSKQIDADRFEEIVRRMTDSMGYKLYNFKKIVSKIEKQVNVLIEGNAEEAQDEEELTNYSVVKVGSVVTICKVGNAVDEVSANKN